MTRGSNRPDPTADSRVAESIGVKDGRPNLARSASPCEARSPTPRARISKNTGQLKRA